MLAYTTGDNRGMYIDINNSKHLYIIDAVTNKSLDVTSSIGNGQIQITRSAATASNTDDLDGGVHYGLTNSRKGQWTAPVNIDSTLDKIFTMYNQRTEDDNMTQEKAQNLVFLLKVYDQTTKEWVLCDGCIVNGLPPQQVSNGASATTPVNWVVDVTSITKSPVSFDEAFSA